MKTPAALVRAESALRAHALGYPDTVEEFPWGHRAIKIRNKTFVFLALDATTLSMSVKLPGSNMAALMLPFASATEYGLGRSGWVTARFGAKESVPLELLMSWIDESFRAIAPKSLVRQLALPDGPQSSAGPTRSKRSATKAAAAPHKTSKTPRARGHKK